MRLKFFSLIINSFKAKLIVSIIFLILLICFFYLFFSLYHSTKILKEGLIEKGKVLVEELGYASEFGILATDPTFVETSILSIFKKKDVLFVIIYNNQGKVIAVKKRIDIDQILSEGMIQEMTQKKIIFWQERDINKEKIYEFHTPIFGRMGIVPSGEIVGFARLGLSLAEMAEKKKEIFFLYLIVTLVFFGFGSGVVIYLTQKSTRPLNKLLEGTKAIKEGRFDYRIQLKTKDEFGRLAEAFNRMAEDLKKHYIALEESKTFLEIRVKARTEEMRELAAGLEERIKERTKGLVESREALMNMLEDVEVERRSAEEERNKTLAIITNFTDGLLIFDRENNLSLINSQAEIFFGLEGKNVIGKPISDLSKIAVLKPLIELFGEEIKEIFRKEFEINENLVLEVSTVPVIRNEKRSGIVVIIHNITREKSIERMKTEFVSLAAHQLRTPLSAIKWTIKMLLEGDLGKITKEQKEFLTGTYKSNERMISLVNNLLNVTRIEEGRYLYRLILADIGETVYSIVNSHKDEAKRRELKFQYRKPRKKLPKAMVDLEKMRIAIDNLINNAVRYTLSGGSVIVSLKYINEEEIEFSVEDTGIGIPENQQGRVFTKFFRGANVIRRETEGTGLGLFIAKNIIEAHGGKIWFKSKEDRGTTFYFTIPTFQQMGKSKK